MDATDRSGHPDDLPAELTAVLEWWREAGVDYGFDDAPRQWIVAADAQGQAALIDADHLPAISPQPVAATRHAIGGDRAHWPAALPAFAEWWLSEPALDAGQVRGRVLPRGMIASPLMVLVPEPEAQDTTALLSGPQGRLLAAMLAAMGLDEDHVYVASALPRHVPMADWRELVGQGLGDVLQWHISLARPQRIIAFGRHFEPLLASDGFESPLSDNVSPQTDPISRRFRHEGGSAPLLVARDLGSLLERPIAKGHFWQQWLAWSAG